MASAEDEGYGRGLHSRYKLGEGKPCFDVAADGVENYEQSLDLRVLLDGDELRNI